jgi:catechol 2,3-dioxygenase-like lactoylglutathione lyase family enzyme
MISGVNHLTFAVAERDRSIDFYGQVLGFELVARWPRGAYFRAGATWVAIIVDDETRSGPLPEYTHVAFTVAAGEFSAMSTRIRASGAEIFQDNSSEGASLYFLDPDGHKLEIHASDLATRLRTARAHPWEGLELFSDESS